jgi:hypothetical protein
MPSKTTNRSKKIRYRKVEFKVTDRQKQLIERYCSAEKTTPVRLMKKSIMEYMDKHAYLLPSEDASYISKNQLNLFDFDKREPIQITLHMLLEEHMQRAELSR